MSPKPAKALLNNLTSQLSARYEVREASNLACELLRYLSIDSMRIALNEPVSLSTEQLSFLDEALGRLMNNEPLQHILGQVEFFGLQLKTDGRALIPRPETEELVDWIIKENAGFDQAILDIGTGTGCIPIALAKHLEKAEVSAIDLSEEALALAKENALLNGVEIQWHQLDILNSPLPGLYGLIVSNPPYIPQTDKAQMAANVLDFEPGIALFVSNEKPLVFYQRIAELAWNDLENDGQLYFEIHERYGQEIVDLLEEIGYIDVILKKDLQEKDRMIKATRP